MKPNIIGTVLFVIFFTLYCLMLVPFAFASIALYFLGVPKKNFANLWYNQDRTLASGLWGTTQETISSEVGRISIGTDKPDGWTPKSRFEHRWACAVAKWLDGTPAIWGKDHTKTAIQHADLLDLADDGQEK